MRLRPAVVVAAAAAGLVALTGCSSSSGGAARRSAPPSLTPAVSVPSSPAPTTSIPFTPPPTASPTAHRSPTHRAASSAPVATTSPSVVERSTCTQVSVRVIPGGAISGREFAALQFTNDGSGQCVLVGYPTVTLLRAGKPIARPSEPAGYSTSRRELAPGATAESKLFDYTQNCQAPLSDGVRVVVPGTTITYHRPQFVMRGCILRVDALGAPE